jgi:sulfite reductase (NADPH) hemoprotein beta-component
VPDVVEAILDTYTQHRLSGETFMAAVRRLGLEPFKVAAQLARQATVPSQSEEASV